MAIYQRSWRALGTMMHVLTTVPDGLDAVAESVIEVLRTVDETYSRFRDDSELTRLNQRTNQAVRVSPLLARAIEVAQRAARISQGAVDPTIGKAIPRGRLRRRLLGHQ